MTRIELLTILIGQARANGFEFRKWFTTGLRLPWQDQKSALAVLETERRYYALLFNHEFAQSFWKGGETITFQVPENRFKRIMTDGSTRTVERKPFMRRSGRPNAWRYHLREMALAEEPLRYMRRYLHVEEEPDDDFEAPVDPSAKPKPPSPTAAQKTLELARKAAERRALAVAALPQMPITRTSKRGARLPGAR